MGVLIWLGVAVVVGGLVCGAGFVLVITLITAFMGVPVDGTRSERAFVIGSRVFWWGAFVLAVGALTLAAFRVQP